MNHLITALALAAMTASAAAADTVALDYRANDASCIDAARFADEVSAKLGFVPFSESASAKIRVRVERDGDHFTGSVINVDGSSKIVDAATCAAVTSKLAVTVAGAVDSTALDGRVTPAAPPAPIPATSDNKVPVSFSSDDGRRIDIALNTGGGVGTATNGVSVVTNFYEGLCTTPCTARLPAGRQYITFQDPDSRSAGGDRFMIDGPMNITLHHKSRRGARWGWFLGGLAATTIGTYALFNSDGTAAVVGGTVGASLGLSAMLLPLFLHDTFTTTQSRL